MFFLRQYIRALLVEAEADVCPSAVDQNPDPDKDDDKEEGPPENLLVEPDIISDEKSKKEASAVAAGGMPSGALRGSTTPLGSDPTFPSKKKKKKKEAVPSGGASWYLPKKR
jgi:hypothetical protein